MQTTANYATLDYMLRTPEPPYQLPEHRIIGSMLNNYGIPFLYRQPTLVYEQGERTIWKPDFTLPSHHTMVIDYLPPDKEYMHRYKQQIYTINDILALAIRHYDLTHTDWDTMLQRKITQVCDQLSALPQYR